MKKIIIMAATVMASAMAFSQTGSKDEQAVRSIITTLEKGWNSRSGETFASVFADVHDYIVVDGLYFSNWPRQANQAAHQGLFDGIYKNYDIKLKVDKVSFIRPDLAMIYAIGGGAETGKPMPEDPGIIMTVLAEKKADGWKIISFHNHNLEATKNKRSPMPLNVMYASWYKK